MPEKEDSTLTKQKILLLEDHIDAQAWLTDAVVLAYGSCAEVTLSESIAAAKSHLEKTMFDLFLVDLNLPDGSGHEALIYAKNLRPDLACIVTTIYSDDMHLFPALKAGATGYILKDESKSNIAQMLKGAHNGMPAISAEVAKRILSYFHEPSTSAKLSLLTEREREVLSLAVRGLSVKECAALMSISYHTVSGYIKEIYRKLGVSSRAEMTFEAIRTGIFPP
jgi:DNA-binding NarL/FixJ family response regulator